MGNFPAQFSAFVKTAHPGSRLRLAPTPSGFLHLGNAVNFTLNWLAARLSGASLLLRIDDLDADRLRPEYLEDIFESLAWLGLDWQEGPRSATDFAEHWSQNTRISLYAKELEGLKSQNLLFACAKSRAALRPYGPQYPLEFRTQAANLDTPDVAWRVQTPPEIPLHDFVVRRRDGIPAYQIASLADDRFFNITHVIRGQDLADSTTAQQWLARTLNHPDFSSIHFLHHPLLYDDTGAKLSKSAGSTALRTLRSAGKNPAFVFATVAQMLSLPIQNPQTAAELMVNG